MSKNHKKKKSNTKNRKPNQKKKQQPFKWHEKLSQKISFSRIKTFFIELLNNIKNQIKQMDIQDSAKKLWSKATLFIKDNRQGVLFTSSLALVVFVGYFAIVYESDADRNERLNPAEIVSIDLKENETTYMENIESEISQIQNPVLDQEALTTLADESIDTLEDDTKALEAIDTSLASEEILEVVLTSDQAVEAPPIEIISSELITNPSTVAMLAASPKPTYDTVENSMSIGIDMYAIIVDGKEVAHFKTEGEAHAVLIELKRKYMAEGALEERIIYKESIEVAKVKRNVLDFNGYQSKEAVMEYIIKGTNEQRIHKVVKGDNFWDIAEKYELNVEDLLDANPEINEKRLQIDTELSLIVAKPIINIVTISTIQRIDLMPYGRDENVETSNYFVGTTKVKRSGVPGEAKNIVEVYSENGKIIGEKVKESTILKEPVNVQFWAGTKPAPPRIGSGSFSNPTSRGYITSGFGNRSLGYHNGIDIGIPMRTDVKAADGGVVIYSGWKGTYGKLVMINHGENKISYYAHNDVLKVKSGDSVSKGQLIALSGNTGRSTGPHLHFEVRINGSPVNPKKFVNY